MLRLLAFAVICKSCQARFLLNDDLLRRKVAGRVVTVRCRQCHAAIEVDASNVETESASKLEVAPAPVPAKLRIAAPPRPSAKSTLIGIGAPRAPGAKELVALSPGFLDVKPTSAATVPASDFPEPPPPPPAPVELLDSDDWEVADSVLVDKHEAEPESLDDFAEELPPSIPPPEDAPNSAGTPSLHALTHHDERRPKPRFDDFFANVGASMNGGITTAAPTIDVSDLTPTPPVATPAPAADLSTLETPVRNAKTLPLFAMDAALSDSGNGDKSEVTPRTATVPAANTFAVTPAATAPAATAPAATAPAATPRTDSADGALGSGVSRSTLEGQEQPSSGRRERRNVVPPTAKSLPPKPAPRRASGLAVPLLVALAAAAGFLIWKRGAAPAAPEPIVTAQREAEPAPLPPAPAVEPAVPAPVAPEASVAAISSATPGDDITFETTPTPVPQATPRADKAAATAAVAVAEPKPVKEPAQAVAKEEPKAAPAAPPSTPGESAGPFDREAAAAALTASAGQASACRKEGDPSGVASVTVTFAPSGRVTSANISGPPFAGTPTGGCIAATLRKTRVPAFEGDRVTVSKTVVIQ